MEFKHIKAKTSEAWLEERALAALKRIKEKDYAEDLRLCGAKPIVAYGIAFYQKKVRIKSEMLLG
ncbi:MAG: PD-(D/E)XK nuclease domain-containing protein [Bacilli bacterium]|nr:PD-(D/E)XK nuclease domain-containing protein [Bacilli bacterium]